MVCLDLFAGLTAVARRPVAADALAFGTGAELVDGFGECDQLVEEAGDGGDAVSGSGVFLFDGQGAGLKDVPERGLDGFGGVQGEKYPDGLFGCAGSGVFQIDNDGVHGGLLLQGIGCAWRKKEINGNRV